jgi:NAD-dependent dihydropyrimidine dehydrogenase PreA subunit
MLKYIDNIVTLQHDIEKCNGCGMCAIVCPHGVFVVEDGKARLCDRDLCMECGACEQNCPEEAIRVKAGVGCATAVLLSSLGRSGDQCCVADD